AAGHPGDTIRSVSLTLGTISILRYGTPEQKKRHIPPRLRGDELAALAITEPQIGSDTSRMQTKAVLKGDRWVINGQKRFITGGGLADYLTLFAITEEGAHPHKGMSTFIVPMDHPGLTTKRIQFKQPIAMFEGVSFKLAEMYAALDASRQLVYRTAKMVEAGIPAQRESAVTKLFVAESVWKVVDHAMQVLGGIGYTTDFPVQAIFRNARLMRIGAGSDEIMKFLIARELLKEVKG